MTKSLSVSRSSSADPAASASNASAADYKQGMRRFASGVTIVATEHAGQRFGLVSTGVSSVSADPPVLLICVNRSASSHDPIARAGRFSVNVLRNGDEDLARRFSSPEHRATRFIDRRWERLATGAPALVDCLVSFDCFVNRALAADTHTVFFGRVAEVRVWDATLNPLLYWNGEYRASSA